VAAVAAVLVTALEMVVAGAGVNPLSAQTPLLALVVLEPQPEL
jgi:hypothetical protein